jgi:polyphenol oxidase
MQRQHINGLYLWQFENLSNEAGIRHFVTERQSNPDGEAFTLSLSSAPDQAFVRNNRALLAKSMQIASDRLFFPSQVHLARIVRVSSSTTTETLADTDALTTDEPGVCIAVMSADCVPVLLYDKKNRAVAAVHSGWKGTVAKIVEKTLAHMAETYGTRGEDVVAAIGPSVCQDSYEVGEEVIEAVHASFADAASLLVYQSNKKARFDLWKANEIQLSAFGVSQIEVSDLCTVKKNEFFFSARRGDRGRFAAGIMLLD